MGKKNYLMFLKSFLGFLTFSNSAYIGYLVLSDTLQKKAWLVMLSASGGVSTAKN